MIKLMTSLLIVLTALLNVSVASAASCALTDVKAYSTDGSILLNANQCQKGPDNNDSANEIGPLFGGTWSELAKIDPFPDETLTGDWDFNSLVAQISNPFVIVVKSSAEYAAYYFNIATNGKGTFTTAGLEPNKKGRDQAISHLTIYTTDSISEVPIPAALWLFAPALMGLIGIRKRYSV